MNLHETNIDLGDIDLKLVPGGSSGEATLSILKDGKWLTVKRPHSKCTSKLANIDSHRLDAKRLRREAISRDPGLKDMIDFFLLGRSMKKPPSLDTSKMKVDVSRDLTQEDIEMLEKASIISKTSHNCRLAYTLKNFKVPKKDPTEARLISDCRSINEQFDLFCEEKMELPKLHTIINWAAKHPIVWSIDANAYFFQFELKGLARALFPLRVSADRGDHEDYILNRLPMGFSLAPIIAQRASNIVVNMTKEMMTEQNIPGEVAAWVDNFMVFADSESCAERAMSILKKNLNAVQIACKEVDKTGEFVGLQRTQLGVNIQEKFAEKLKEELWAATNTDIMNIKNAQELAGKIMWLNYSIVRTPLALRPATLEFLREIPGEKESIDISAELKKELKNWARDADKTFTLEHHNTPRPEDLWTDATPTRLAIVIDNTVFIAKLDEGTYEIAIMEALAAAWGIIMLEGKANLFIDNQQVAYAIAKGHCRSKAINSILRKIYENEQLLGNIFWVPSASQIADNPTRDKLLVHSKDRPSEILKLFNIRSTFVQNPNIAS